MSSVQTVGSTNATVFAPPRRVLAGDRCRARAIDSLVVAAALASLVGLFMKWHDSSREWLVNNALAVCPKAAPWMVASAAKVELVKGIRECAPGATERFVSAVRSAPAAPVAVFLLAFVVVALGQMLLVTHSGATIGQRAASIRHPGRCRAGHAAAVVVWREAPVLAGSVVLLLSGSVVAACVVAVAAAGLQVADPVRGVSDRLAGPVVCTPPKRWASAPASWPTPTGG